MNARQKRLFEEARKRNPNLKVPSEPAAPSADLTDEDFALIKQGVGDKTPRTGGGLAGAAPGAEAEPAAPLTGTVVKYFAEKGFGFIRPEDGGKDVFFHVTRLVEGFPDDLVPMVRVSYDLDYDRTGKLQATNLRILKA